VVGYTGKIIWDGDKPDGSPRKLMDSGKITSLGWSPRVTISDGLRATYKAYIERYK
jgi:GDP-L-fucose synthase